MSASYHIDLNKFTLKDYAAYLKRTNLPPSRKILQEDPDSAFDILAKEGITTPEQVLKSFNTKDKIKAFKKLDENYLTLLVRDIKSLLPKPVKLSDIPGLKSESVNKLESMGIKHTKALFPYVLNNSSREELHQSSGIRLDEIEELSKLTDMSRIKWVGALFARMLVDVGCDSVAKASEWDPEDLHEKINRINKEREYFKGAIGLNDMKILVLAAGIVPQVIEL